MSYILGNQSLAPSYTWGGKPPSFTTGQPVFMSDVGTKGSYWFYDGTRWKPFGGQQLLATLDSSVGPIANSETITHQYLMPAGLWQVGDRLRVFPRVTKSGTTDAGTIKTRIGTAGTTSDTQITSGNALGAGSQQWGAPIDLLLASATSVQALPVTAAPFGTGASNTALLGAVTISNVSNALYINVGISSSSTNDTLTQVSGEIYIIGSAN